MFFKQGQIKPDIVLNYISTFQLYLINRYLSSMIFDNLYIILIIKRKIKLFPSKKQNRLLSIKDIFEKIIKNKLLSIIDLSINKVFKIMWIDFMRM